MDNQIIITKSGVRITPYKKGQAKVIESVTSTWDPVRHRKNPFNGFFNDVDKEFYTYKMSNEFLKNNFPTYDIVYEKAYTYRKCQSFNMNSAIQLTDIQMAITDELIRLAPSTMSRVFVHLQTGYGKTVLTISRLATLGYASLIMCYSVRVLKQWMKTFKTMTDIDMNRVMIIDSSSYINNVLEGKVDPYQYDIFLCTPGILTGYGDRYGFDNLSEFFRITGIGIKVFDEAHRNVSNIILLDAVTNVSQTIYLSADYNQADPVKRKKYYDIFHNVPIIEPKIEIMNDRKYIDAIVIDYTSKPSLSDITWVTQTKRGFSQYNYMKYQMDHKAFIKPLESVLNTILQISNHGKILVMLNMIEHVDIMTEYIKNMIPSTINIGGYHSKVDPEIKDQVIDCDIIVTTVQSFGVGVDIGGIKHVIVLPQLNEIDDNQTAGRARPPKDDDICRYYMFVDSGFDYCNKKIRRRLSYLQAYKARKIFKITY